MLNFKVVWAGMIDGRLYWLRDDCGSGIEAARDSMWRFSLFMEDGFHYGRLIVFAQLESTPPRLRAWEWIRKNLGARPMSHCLEDRP